jgi:hypothetical protein
VDAGRLDPNDELRALSAAGAAVLGDPAELTAHRCRHGNWFFLGMAIAAVVAAVLELIPLSPLWLITLGLIVGYLLNERERKHIQASIAERSRPTT